MPAIIPPKKMQIFFILLVIDASTLCGGSLWLITLKRDLSTLVAKN